MTAYSDTVVDAESIDSFFHKDQLARIDPARIPKHIAIIMDGNRRWAKMRGLPPIMGHWEGAEVLTDVVRAASELGIKTVTVYSFSTENWGRSGGEIEELMGVFELSLIRKREGMIKDGVRLDAIGDLARLPISVQEAFYETRRATAHCSKINLNLALNYGGRDEIRRAVVKILQENQKNPIDPKELTEKDIARYLDTNPWGDPDLLIRTSGELRVSNFLLWQISYAEIYMTDVLWPEFSPQDLFEAIVSFQGRIRRRGGG